MTTILDWPTDIRDPSTASLLMRGMTQTAQSPFDGSMQTLALPGWRWQGTMQWAAMPLDQYRNLQQFLGQLGGAAGRFKFTHPLCARQATATPGTPLVNGASQTGNILVTDGWTAGALVLKRGDFFSWDNAASRPQLHQVVADVTANGSGQASLYLSRPLRTSPADNAALNVATPYAVWMLANDDQGSLSASGANRQRGNIALEFFEALV